jgi:hypothetical protein
MFPTHFASKTVEWLNFHKKYKNKNYYILNACGLAIFFQIFTFIGSSVICLSLSEIPICTHQRQFGLNTDYEQKYLDFGPKVPLRSPPPSI